MERLLAGGRLVPMDPHVRGDTVLVRDGLVAAVAPFAELRRLHPRAEIVPLDGALLLPGLHDTHTHLYELARRRAGVDLSRSRTLEDVKDALRAHRDRVGAQPRWVGGGGWDPGKYGGAAGFDRALLDEVFADRPVALEARDLHTLWCNTAALDAAGVLRGANAPPGGAIGRRPDGSPDGFLYETAWELVWKARPPETRAVAERWMADTIAHAHSLGLTGVHSMEPMSTYEVYAALRSRDALTLRTCFHTPSGFGIADGEPPRPPSYASTDPWLRLGGMKIFADGSLGSRSAWMREPYPDGSHGTPLIEEEELLDLILRAGRRKVAPTIHAIGDATVDRVSRCLAQARRRLQDPDLFLRIEHAQCVRPDVVRRIAATGIYCAVQPVHLGDDIELLDREWGEASTHAYPLRSLESAGVRLGFGSDAPVATLDPRVGIFAAAERRAGNRPQGERWHEEQALSVREALAAYTIDAARGSCRHEELGSITPGKQADLVAMDDVLDEDASAWLHARIHWTMVGGEIVYDGTG